MDCFFFCRTLYIIEKSCVNTLTFARASCWLPSFAGNSIIKLYSTTSCQSTCRLFIDLGANSFSFSRLFVKNPSAFSPTPTFTLCNHCTILAVWSINISLSLQKSLSLSLPRLSLAKSRFRSQVYIFYTVFRKKHPLMFSIITPTFLGRFLYLVETLMNTLQSTYLIIWWHYNCVTSHVTKVYFIELLHNIKYTEFWR